MKTVHKQLFGGALVGAGIAASAAMTTTATADFIAAASPFDTTNYSFILGIGFLGNVSLSDSTYAAAFPTPQSYSANGLDMSAYAGVNLMGVSLTLTDTVTWGIITTATTYQWFTVEYDKEVTLEWDLSNADYGFANVYQLGFGNIYLAVVPSAGSVTLNLTPGNTYYFAGSVEKYGFSGIGGGFVRLSNIPAPGALAVLGLAGMIGGRRRRRQ